MAGRTRWLVETALLAALITVTGIFKIPGLVPGTEFQLSAPLAVAICVVFGFTKYITAGMISSLVGLILGTQNLFNVAIALIFRLSVGIILAVFGHSKPVIILAGPVGSFIARLAVGGLLGKAAIPLVIAALPGMLYTALTVLPLVMLFKRVKSQTEKVL
ncbi:MAG: hypothetical protein GX348_01310 [Veillonellaceae bacterium]|mgnify:CR=1 FL=1|jgi:hypothetical protein|nr:hypothetical protein [Veillonellaceae bacterium]